MTSTATASVVVLACSVTKPYSALRLDDLERRLAKQRQDMKVRLVKQMGDLGREASKQIGDLGRKTSRQMGEVGRELNNRLRSTVGIIAGPRRRLAGISALVALLLR